MVQTCPNCGSPNREGYRFCSTCGAALSSAGETQPGQSRATSNASKYTVQSWEEKVVGDPAAPTAEGLAIPTPPAYSTPSVPPPPTRQYASTSGGSEASDLPPIEADRKGEATYAPYT